MINDNEFVDIPGYDGIYSINRSGVVKSIDRIVPRNSKYGPSFIKGKEYFGWKGGDGYIHIKLSKNGVSDSWKMHQLLAIMFIPNPHNFECVRHFNDIKIDNRIENLVWGTRKDNAYDQMRNGIFKPIKCKGAENFHYGKRGKNSPNYGKNAGENNKKSKIILDTQTGVFYYGLQEAANAKGLKKHTLWVKLKEMVKNNTGLIEV